MSKAIIFPVILIFIILSGCENMNSSKEVEDIISRNDLNLELKLDENNEFSIDKLVENESADDSYLKIVVKDKFSMRGKVDINPDKKYKLSIVLRNDDSDPIITYSYWKGLVTLVRSYTIGGKNGNPPTSRTQEFTKDWQTYEAEIKAAKGENGFMLSLVSNNGTFYIKDIRLEEI